MSSPFQIATEYKVFGAEDVIRTQMQLIQSFKEGGLSVDEFNAAVKQNTESSRTLGYAYRDLHRVVYAQNFELTKSLQIMRSIGSIGHSLLGMWQAYTLGQYRLEQSQRAVSDSQSEVNKWNVIYLQYLKDFGPNSALTLDALDKLRKANEDLATAQGQAKSAADSMIAGYVSMGMASIGDVAQIGLLSLKIQELGGLSMALAPLITAFESLAVAIAPIAVLIAASAIGRWAKENLAELNKAQGLPEEAPFIPNAPTSPSLTSEQKNWLLDTFKGWLGIGQFGIPFVPQTGPYYLHEGESVLTKGQSRVQSGLAAERQMRILQAHVTQYNTIYTPLDEDAMARRLVKKVMQSFADKGW
jgi:hypothetical protein